MRRTCATVLGLAIAFGAHGQDARDRFKSLNDGKAMADRVLNDYVKKDQAEAIRSLPRLSSSRTDEEQRVQIQKVVSWNATSSEKRGAPVDFKLESTKTVSDVVTRLRYVVLCERMPATWDFYFYRTGVDKDWQLADLKAASGPMNLFETGDR